MAWVDNLQEASFRGFIFDCISTDDKLSRAHSVHSYPYADGAEIEDLGAEPVPISITAIIYGDDYDTRLQAFIAKLNEPGIGALVHPVFGNIDVQFVDCSFHHDAESPDQATITLNFLQNSIAPKFFGQTLAIQKASAILQKNSLAREAATAVLAEQVLGVKNSDDFNRIQQLRTTMTSALAQIKAEVNGIITSGLDPINFASSWAADITTLITGIVDLRSFDISTLTQDWKSVFNAFSTAIILPAQARQPLRDPLFINAQIVLDQASGKADAASLVLASETQTPTLSAQEIETMVNEVRGDIQTTIDLYREIYPTETSRLVTEPLKDTALALHDAAIAVIEARPPLVIRTMDAPGNLRLIAHKLYGDHTRATELFRLNPKAMMPNFIDRGDALNAYAQ